MINVILSEKTKYDWRAGCIIAGEKSDYEYRAQGASIQTALRDLSYYIEKEIWDCEHPKETAVLSLDSCKILQIIGDLLQEASNLLSNQSCNDWEFPSDWTEAEKIVFVKDMYDRDNRTDFDPTNLNVPNWWVARYLAKRLRNG